MDLTKGFKKVFIKDWHGILKKHPIIDLKMRGDGRYSCVFTNSEGETEKKMVEEKELFKR